MAFFTWEVPKFCKRTLSHHKSRPGKNCTILSLPLSESLVCLKGKCLKANVTFQSFWFPDILGEAKQGTLP